MTIEDEARARLEEQLSRAEHYGRQLGNAPVKRATFNVEDVRTLLAASRREPSGATTRKAIADAVRHHCTLTPNPMNGPYPLDATVQAVADWIENPPEWVRFPSESTAVGASDGTSKSNANDLERSELCDWLHAKSTRLNAEADAIAETLEDS